MEGIPVTGIWAKHQITPTGIVSLEQETHIAIPGKAG